MKISFLLATALFLSSATGMTSASPCTVAKVQHSIHEDYTCGREDAKTRATMVYYPTGGNTVKTYPVVLFHVGSKGYSQNYDDLMESIAKQCLIVIVPKTSENPTTNELCKTDIDLRAAYAYAKNSDNWTNKWGMTANPDWSRIGGGGHSAGGHHLPVVARGATDTSVLPHPKFNALVYSHAGGQWTDPNAEHYKPDLNACLNDDNGGCKAPSFFLTSRDDTTVQPGYTFTWFNLFVEKHPSPPGHTVYAKTPSGTHMEPVNGAGLLNAYVGRFFACHLFTSTLASHATRKTESCDYIYGINSSDTPGICTYIEKNAVDGKTGTCNVKGSNPARSATSAEENMESAESMNREKTTGTAC